MGHMINASLFEKLRMIFRKKRIFITADHHFYHENIIKYCNRPFKSAEEMNSCMIHKWNSVVSEKDIVYHLGDFALARNFDQVKIIKDQLKGKIILIPGNHDNISRLRKSGIDVSNSDAIIIGTLVLSHRPLEHVENGLVNVHGHIHEKATWGRRINASVDKTDFEPQSIEKYFEEARKLLIFRTTSKN